MPEAVVAIIQRDGRALIVERSASVRCPGFWSPLSGRLEPGESQAEAVAREVREEVGLDVRPMEKVWECETDDGAFTLHWWTVECLSEVLRLEPTEVSAARWVNAEEFFRLAPTFEGDRTFFRDVWPKLVGHT